jgi:hypothetical protein
MDANIVELKWYMVKNITLVNIYSTDYFLLPQLQRRFQIENL